MDAVDAVDAVDAAVVVAAHKPPTLRYDNTEHLIGSHTKATLGYFVVELAILADLSSSSCCKALVLAISVLPDVISACLCNPYSHHTSLHTPENCDKK